MVRCWGNTVGVLTACIAATLCLSSSHVGGVPDLWCCGADMEAASAPVAPRKRMAVPAREVGLLPFALFKSLVEVSTFMRIISMPIELHGKPWFCVLLGMLDAADVKSMSRVCKALSRRFNKFVDAYMLAWELIEWEALAAKLAEKKVQEQQQQQEQDALEDELMHDMYAQQEAAERRFEQAAARESDIVSYNLGVLATPEYVARWGDQPPIQDVDVNHV